MWQIDAAEIAKEVVKNIPEPITPAQTYVFGLLVISGYLIAGLVGWYFVSKEKRQEIVMQKAREKDNELTEKAIAAMTTASNSIMAFTNEANNIRAGIDNIKETLSEVKHEVKK